MSSNVQGVTDFFVLRVPRLGLEKIRQLPTTEIALLDYLASWLASAGVMEAIYLASPSLVERLELWREKPLSKSGRKVTAALLKYLVRMSSRPTPFGLFSGVASGSFADSISLKPANMQLDKRKTRLDMFYLATIQQQWTQSEDGQQSLRYLPNTTLYQLGSYLHYIEPYQSSAQRQYRLSSVELDEALKSVLHLATGGELKHNLIQRFCKLFPSAEQEDVEGYIQQLIQEQVLVADLKLPLTSGQTDHAFAQSLLQAENHRDGLLLQAVLGQLACLDQQPDVTPADYQNVVLQLKQLPYTLSENKLFQTDVVRTMQHSRLDVSLSAMLEKTILALKSQMPLSESPFQTFISSFQQRYEGQIVPLLELLDEDVGISFSADTGYETPLLAGINIARRNLSDTKKPQSPLEQHLINAMSLQTKSALIQLSSAELLKLTDCSQLWQQLPASFAATVSCYRDKEGAQLIHFHGCSGPSGANLLGRFCHLDDELKQRVKDYLAAEEALSPDVIFAEVVHMPDGRPGNVIARPQLRQYEIVFLADSVLPQEQQIPVQDLYVFVEAGQVKLWSKRLNKQVIPRLTSAHNYSARSLGIYRFLCMLQHQHGRLPNFNNPAVFARMERQPRVQLDNVILQEEQWLVERSLLAALVNNDQWQSDAWQTLVLRYQLQRYVCYAISDNILTIDLHNPSMISMLLAETTGQSRVSLKESLTMQYHSEVVSEEGDFAHEIVVPLLNAKAQPFVTLHPNPAKQLDMQIARNFAPGSEWLSIKIYAAHSSAELILADVVSPFLQQCKRDGLVERWFFIRYGDPDWHLRLRLFGDPALLYSKVLPLLHQQLAPWLNSQRVRKMEIFTYQREIERYGGDNAMALAEQVFRIDSDLVLSTMQLIQQQGEPVRWRMALLGVDAMLSAFGYDVAQKLDLISQLRQRFGQEFQEHALLRNQLGKKYREYQALLRSDFQSLNHQTNDQLLQRMLAARQQFLQQLQPVAQQILTLQQLGQLSCSLDTLLHSFLHMFNNRIFKAYGREQEFVVYDFLRRFYLSCQAQRAIKST